MEKIYLDSAATSLVQPEVLAACNEFLALYRDPSLSASDITLALRSSLKDARAAVAQLLHCSTEEIALVQSTSHALGMLSVILPLEPGDNILMCDLEYQASTISFEHQASVCGYEVRCVETQDGIVTPDDFLRHIDQHSKAIVLASVQEINGYRADVKSICTLCREHGIISVIDGIQEAGSLDVNVKELGMDIYCGGGKKWLGNPFGMGFLYLNQDTVLHTLEPYAHSYFCIQMPKAYPDYISYLEDPRRHPFDEYQIVPDASRFEIGGYSNYPGAFGLKAAVTLLLQKDVRQIEAHIKRLVHRYIDGLQLLGIRMCSPTDDFHMSAITSFNFGLIDNNIEKERELVRYLQQRNIYVSLRCSTGTGGVRTSFNYYNTEQDVDTALKAIHDFLISQT